MAAKISKIFLAILLVLIPNLVQCQNDDEEDIKAKSLYISRAVSYFHETEFEIWADWRVFFFQFFMVKRIMYRIVASSNAHY